MKSTMTYTEPIPFVRYIGWIENIWLPSAVVYNFSCQFEIVAASRGMHVSLAKHSFAWLPRKMTTGQTERQTDGQTDAGQSDPYVPLCFADKKDSCIRHGPFDILGGGAWNFFPGQEIFFRQFWSKIIFFAGPSGRIIFFITKSYNIHVWAFATIYA